MDESRFVVVAPDDFKGSASSRAVAAALERGLARTLPPGWSVRTCPLADGGDGTLEAILAARDGVRRTCRVTGPNGDSVTAAWGDLGGGRAVVEMAQASGLTLLEPRQRDPMHATSRGTGELIREAVEHGARRVVVGLGGSATVDGGLGLARGLGFECLDARGRPVPAGGAGLEAVASIRNETVPEGLGDLEVLVACDVTNPLLGPDGGIRVYAPQKGADPATVERLESAVDRWANVLEEFAGRPMRDEPGAGAAGGLGFGLMGLLDAELAPGAEVVMDATDLNSHLVDADVLITGEGTLDRQTTFGKCPWAVARRARERDVPFVFAVTGELEDDLTLYETFDLILTLPSGPLDREACMTRAETLLTERGADLGRIVGLLDRAARP